MKKTSRSFFIFGIVLISFFSQSQAIPRISTTGEQTKQASGAYPQQADNSEWKQLFNGKDLTGWKHVGPGSQYVEDGLIKSHGGMGLLYWTGEMFGDC